MEKENIVLFVEEKKNGEGKGGKYLFDEEKKKRKGKGEKYLEKENTYFAEEKNEER